MNWQHGTLVTPPTPAEPPGLDERGDEIAALLDTAEDIVNAAGPSIMAELRAEQERDARGNRLARLFKRKRRE